MSIRCMTPGCGKIKQSRGVCRSCYRQLIDQVKAGKATWLDHEIAGKCLPPKISTFGTVRNDRRR